MRIYSWTTFVLLPALLFAAPQVVYAEARSTNACALAPGSLKIDFLAAPNGLDTATPKFGWILHPTDKTTRGHFQTAYQIKVASRLELLGENVADLWDSGVVPSDQMADVHYAGKTLRHGMRSFWSVRVSDENGRWSAWSQPEVWSNGPISNYDWSSSWIGTQTTNPPFSDGPLSSMQPDPWFRREIQLQAKPSRAMAYIASVGYHELYVNGEKIGDAVLTPSVSDYTKRARYVAYDITPFLHAGNNALGIWLGTGWSVFANYQSKGKPRSPIVTGQVEIEYADGTKSRVVTDASWRTHPSPNQLLGQWYYGDFGGESYDARNEIPGWSRPGIDERSWVAATVYQPNLIISAEKIEPNRRVRALEVQSIVESAPGIYRVDMGRNFTGWVEISTCGQPGDRIDVNFSEQENISMTHNLRSSFVLNSTQPTKWENHFNYMTGRWVTIRGLRSQPLLTDVRGWMIRTDYARASSFQCSLSLLNQIHETALWTLENLSLGGYLVDCPQRERMGYGGDAHATLNTLLMNYHAEAFLLKWAEDWRDVQVGTPEEELRKERTGINGEGGTETGHIPYTAPTHLGGGGPAWSGFSVQQAWEVYQNTGDPRILRESFPAIERWLAFLETKAAANLLQRWGGKWDFLGDWLWPGARSVNGDTRESLFFNNCYWAYCLASAANMAEVLHRPSDRDAYNKRADVVRHAIHVEFFEPATNSYVNGDPAYLAIALLAKIPPDDRRAGVWQRLEEEIIHVRHGNIHAGITGGAFLFKALMLAHRDDLIYAMVSKDTYPSWGHMLKRGATTFWEAWEDDADSRLHSSYLYVGAWFINGVLGIQSDPGKAGFKSIILRPGPVDEVELSWAKGHYDSASGRIGSEWRRENGVFYFTAEIPVNTTALVYLPSIDDSKITEGGRALSSVREITLSGHEADRAVIKVPSGRYQFRSIVRR